MFSRATTLFAMTGLIAATMPACTTVDLTQISVPSKAQSQAPVQNVVQRTASKLASVFRNEGWSTFDAQSRMTSAASILLKGLPTSQGPDAVTRYAAQKGSSDAILQDVRRATEYVTNTTKAAEVFLATTTTTEDITAELGSLEEAIKVTTDANALFTRALSEQFNVIDMPEDCETLNAAIRGLNAVADSYGNHVRAALVTPGEVAAF